MGVNILVESVMRGCTNADWLESGKIAVGSLRGSYHIGQRVRHTLQAEQAVPNRRSGKARARYHATLRLVLDKVDAVSSKPFFGDIWEQGKIIVPWT